jgi:SNF2 family DNA or RNA helicase
MSGVDVDVDVDAPAAGGAGAERAEGLIPPRAGIEYLAHQETGVRWMMEREREDAPVCRGGILGDDMGLGKTFQTIGLLKNSPYALRTLIICPPALMSSWTDELTACGYVVSTLLAGSSAWTPVPAGKTGVWLTTYPKACLYARGIAHAETAFQRVVLDEGHIIRNGRATSRWTNCMAIAKRAVCRWILSATPVQNGPNDWRNLCWWLRVRCKSAEIPELGPTLMLRRTMGELRDAIEALPPPPRFISHDLTVPSGGSEEKLFRALCDQLQTALDSKTVSALIKLELYLRIQQFLVHPQIYIESMRAKFKGAYPRPNWTGTATKWEAVMEELAVGFRRGESQIVFCNFRKEMDYVTDAAERLGAAVFSIRGGMGAVAVGESVRDAREAAESGAPVVVVVQIVSGGAGLNLQFCTRILFMSQHWNPAVVHQAVGRAVRIGQRAVVEIHVFRVVDAVFTNLDRRMLQIHMGKISGAREICGTLYEGYEPLRESVFEDREEEAGSEDEDEDEPTAAVEDPSDD